MTRDRAAADFLALHSGPGFVLPNAWDAGSARILEQVETGTLGFLDGAVSYGELQKRFGA